VHTNLTATIASVQHWLHCRLCKPNEALVFRRRFYSFNQLKLVVIRLHFVIKETKHNELLVFVTNMASQKKRNRFYKICVSLNAVTIYVIG